MAWMVNKWIHMIDWPGQKGIEPLFVVFVIVLNELMKQSLNHKSTLSYKSERAKQTQQLNTGHLHSN